MLKNNMILNCSTKQPVKLKVRVKRPVCIPPRLAVCLSVNPRPVRAFLITRTVGGGGVGTTPPPW